MPVIQTAPDTSGGGGGDATAANQVTQINSADATNNALQDVNGYSVFSNSLDISVFKTVSNLSIIETSNIAVAGTQVQSFANSTPSALALDIENFFLSLLGNGASIISIVYADAGGIAPNPHTALIVYNSI